MAQRRSRYRQLEQYITLALLADAVLFILYMVVAGNGIAWLKVFFAVLCFLISLAVLGLLFMTQEIRRRRSLWMTAGAAAITLVVLLSLILNFPCPNPRNLPVPGPVEDAPAAAVLMEENI